jgi:hypothetical protein
VSCKSALKSGMERGGVAGYDRLDDMFARSAQSTA